MILIIDGNNLLGFLGRDASADNREYLINFLKKNILKSKKVILVFDNKRNFVIEDDLKEPNFQIRFSDPQIDQDADDRIVRLVKSLLDKSEIRVVTADKGLIFRLKDQGVLDFFHPQDFLNKLQKKVVSTYTDCAKEDLLSPEDRDKIFQELMGKFKSN